MFSLKKIKNWNQSRGLAGEKLAEQFLIERQYQMIARRYRCRYGEIDLIAARCQSLAFVEVKYRTSSKFGDPFEALTAHKINNFRRSCEYYLQNNSHYKNYEIECLAIAIRHYSKKPEIECRRIF